MRPRRVQRGLTRDLLPRPFATTFSVCRQRLLRSADYAAFSGRSGGLSLIHILRLMGRLGALFLTRDEATAELVRSCRVRNEQEMCIRDRSSTGASSMPESP